MEFQKEFGCEQDILDTDECVTIEPALTHIRRRIKGGVLTRSDETGDCYQFCNELIRILASGRCKLMTNVKVGRLLGLGQRIVGVETNRGAMEADAYVVAAGIGSQLFFDPSVSIRLLVPLKGYSLTIPLDRSGKAPKLSVTDHEHKIVYAPFGRELRVAGIAELGAADARISTRALGEATQGSPSDIP